MFIGKLIVRNKFIEKVCDHDIFGLAIIQDILVN